MQRYHSLSPTPQALDALLSAKETMQKKYAKVAFPAAPQN